MTEVATALQTFYSGFAIPAYVENTVPDNAALPYITYTVPQSGVFSGAIHQCRVWYAGTTYAPVNAKADEIIAAIGQGVKMRSGDGYVCIYPGVPLAQVQPSDDDTRIVYINLELRSYV